MTDRPYQHPQRLYPCPECSGTGRRASERRVDDLCHACLGRGRVARWLYRQLTDPPEDDPE